MVSIAADTSRSKELKENKNFKGCAAQMLDSFSFEFDQLSKFQGILADELPGVLSISRQEFSHFFFFFFFGEYIPTSIDRQHTTYMTQSIAVPRMI